MKRYVLGVDQSTQGTKAIIFDEEGALICRRDIPHRQIISEEGYVSHDLNEIWDNTLAVIKNVIEGAGIDKSQVAVMGISNQRETTCLFDRVTGKPLDHAIVWQCNRAEGICRELERNGYSEMVRQKTGIKLSPYFPAAKLAWLLKNVEGAAQKAEEGEALFGTIECYLIYRLTGGTVHKTDYSNASRTQLLNLRDLIWDQEILDIYGIPKACMPEVDSSNGDFGETDLGGYLDRPIPIRAAFGDSHGALYGQGCHKPGMIKVTYGTGSSIMMNIGEEFKLSDEGVVTSIAYALDGKINYCLEGNINYTGAVITWLKDNLKLIESAKETADLAYAANEADRTYLVPAFTGLGAPYWDSNAKAIITGITRTTGKNEVVRAALQSISYQISDIVKAMERTVDIPIKELRVDGGPTRNPYLMKFQSDILNVKVNIPDAEELSGIGAAYAAGIAVGILKEDVFDRFNREIHEPDMAEDLRKGLYEGWLGAVRQVMRQHGED